MNNESLAYQKKILNPFWFKIGMLFKLPSVFFWGIRVTKLETNSCELTIPFCWRTQNPFSSVYFAALAGAAELSTGALCQLQLAGRTPHSMLVVDFKMKYLKKANTKITFVCNQGDGLSNQLDKLKDAGDTVTMTMISEGRNIHGETVCLAEIIWSFKKK
ncbi:MAG: DUF4442 domain-containing protein [Saprospiraceae bacterium]|jgi:hypothetical protein|nr:DUF4442 domain-containing protein [Saprospiraceae bacterium]MBK9564641.1 DUF4442 domain-containing protein [Saprospiraceae bacterium]